MASFKPLVSIIVPTYNYAHFICEAIDSVLTSNFPQRELEIIIIDDGSTDDTAEKVKIYKNRIRYIYRENAGKALAIKTGIDHAQGRYLFTLMADDLFLPQKIQKVFHMFESDKDLNHVTHPAIYWNMSQDTRVVESIPACLKGRKILGQELLSFFYRRNMLFGGGSTFAARRDILAQIPFSREINMHSDEYLILWALKSGYSYFIDEPLSIWRIHGDNFTEEVQRGTLSSVEKKAMEKIKSREAVLRILTDNYFGRDVQQLYYLKTQVYKLAIKEISGTHKTLWDILELWKWVISNVKTFKGEIFGIIKNYTILNRTLPTFLFWKLKKIKNFIKH